MDRYRDIGGLDKEIRILQASNDQCTRENNELRRKISAMETELKSTQDETIQAQISHGMLDTKLVILQTKFIACLSNVMNNICGGAKLNYNTFENCIDLLKKIFDDPESNGAAIKQVKEALMNFNI